MSLMPSLCAALERVGGERLVMRAGERPHVLAGDRRHDVATAVLSVTAVEALAEQILSADGRRELIERGAVVETVESPSFPQPLTARAERVGDDFCVELLVTVSQAEPEEISLALEDDQLFTPVEPIQDSRLPSAPPAVVEQFQEAAAPPAPIEVHDPVPSAPAVTSSQHRVTPLQVATRVEEKPQHRSVSDGRTDLLGWISRAHERGASTLYLRAGAPPSARIDDRIERVGLEAVDSSLFEELTAVFTRGGDGIWHPGPDGEWLRHSDDLVVSCRMFADHHGTGVVVHLRPQTTRAISHKYIPRQLRSACEGDGLLVVSSPEQSDLEAMAVAITDFSGRRRGGYIIALQAQTATRHEITGGFVSQRTVGGGEADLAAAIRRAAHEGPDILLVIGAQSESSMQEAVKAATGRLVIVAAIAPSTVHLLRTMAGHAGAERARQAQRALASTFRGGVGFRTLRRLGGGRSVIQELLVASKEVHALLDAGDFDGLARVLQLGADGNRSVDDALARSVTRGHISLRQAAAQAVDRSHVVATVRQNARARWQSVTRGAARATSHLEDSRALESVGTTTLLTPDTWQ